MYYDDKGRITMDYENYFRNKVRVVSLLCAVLVLFLHSFAYVNVTHDIFAYHLQFFISRNLAQVAVPFFFALSGFLFYRKFELSQLKRKWISRFRSLFIPYLIWNTIYMLVTYAISPLPFINQEPFALTAETLYNGIFLYAYNGPYWYVFQLICLTLLCPVLYCVLKKRSVATIFLIAIIALYSADIRFIHNLEIRALVFYCFGAYFAMHFPNAVIRSNRASLLGIATFILSQIIIYSSIADTPATYIFARLFMIVAIWDLSNLIASIKLPSALMDCSFPIFTMHTLPLETFNKLFSFVLSPSSNLILLDYFFSPALTIMIIVLVNKMLLQYFPCLHSILFGGRAKLEHR